ncbi:universal stress protein [Gordonia sp. PKS22-38]|uniref:Universal stress protein n=1 Tax=Gordonia prachuapensis TaxID=3115651 RepID=A0ABU7MYF6_9ACTN|nr:universal stress protein [Gordonia sp. PKS22-38]
MDDLPHGIVVVGYSGTSSSRDAALAQADSADPSCRIALVMAIEPPRSPRSDTFLHDELKSEAYLLSDGAIVDEQLRHARELVARRTTAAVTGEAIVADPVRALVGAVARHRATAVVVGMRKSRPTGQVRRIARELPDGVDLFATDGLHHVRLATRSAVSERRRSPILRPVAGPAGA